MTKLFHGTWLNPHQWTPLYNIPRPTDERYKGGLYFAEKRQSKWKCEVCGEVKWQDGLIPGTEEAEAKNDAEALEADYRFNGFNIMTSSGKLYYWSLVANIPLRPLWYARGCTFDKAECEAQKAQAAYLLTADCDWTATD